MVIEQLQRLGFTQYEALAYVALLKENPLNGYELARQSGIPRPNIYPVLQKLEERGAVLRMDTPEGVRYTPLSPDNLISKLNHQYQGVLEAASSALGEISTPASVETILNLRGYDTLLEHARLLLGSARANLYLITWPEEAQALGDALREAHQRGVRSVTLCPKACSRICPNCQGDLFRIPVSPAADSRWLVVVQDGVELLAGEIDPQHEAQGVRSRQEMLINLTTGYIQNSTALAQIVRDIGGRLDGLVTAQTLEQIETLQFSDRWFDTLRQRIQPREKSN